MYIGKTPTVGNFQVCDAISVVNGQAAYTLQVGGTNVAPESANHMLVSLNGILQKPGSSFTISGSTMTFASNLATGDVIDFVQILGNVLDIGQPSDDTVTAAKINDDVISGQTALAATPADTDELLISDAGTIKRIDFSHLKSANTPAFMAERSATQSLSNNVWTKIQNNVEVFDTDGAFDNSTNYRFTVPSGAAGKYAFCVAVNIHDLGDGKYVQSALYKNGSKLKEDIAAPGRGIPTSVNTLTTDDASVGDYYEAYVKNRHDATRDLNYIYGNVFYGYKLIT